MSSRLQEVLTNLLTPVAKRGLLTWERLESGISFDLTSSRVRANPYEIVTTKPGCCQV